MRAFIFAILTFCAIDGFCQSGSNKPKVFLKVCNLAFSSGASSLCVAHASSPLMTRPESDS
jgi:hypothetical protein